MKRWLILIVLAMGIVSCGQEPTRGGDIEGVPCEVLDDCGQDVHVEESFPEQTPITDPSGLPNDYAGSPAVSDPSLVQPLILSFEPGP